jgi:hypothetical protein
MKDLFRRFTHSTLGLVVFLCALSPVSGIGGEAPVMVAKLTADTPVMKDDQAVFDRNHPKMKAAMAAQDRHTRELLAIPEVVGTATGLADTGNPAILIFTKRDVPPGVVPASIDGVPTVVKVTGEITALAGKGFNNTAVLTPPVPIGVSTGNIGECSAGTIGARVISGATVYALSNNHVYALENGANIDDRILQPGLYDTQCVLRGNTIGKLSNFVPILFNNTDCPTTTATCNTVDAAIAAVSSTDTGVLMLGKATPPGGYGIPNSQTYSSPFIGQAVQKYGRTTSLTRGTINGINATVNVSYGTGKNAIFTGQIVIGSGKPFSKAGDSGSLIVTNDSNAYPVGLLFAGGTGTTIANPIDLVLSKLNVAIDGTSR